MVVGTDDILPFLKAIRFSPLESCSPYQRTTFGAAMKIAELTAFDTPLAIADHDRPEPGAGEVLVQFAAASLNYRDYMIMKGWYNPNIALPLVPLSDGAGEVVAVGDGVSRLAVGDRVASLFFPDWHDGPPSFVNRGRSAGCEAPGVLREFGVYGEAELVKVPAHLSHAEAACFPCAGVTAWRAISTLGNTQAGDTVLVLGTGGVALLGLQFAKALGAKVALVSSSDEKIERAKALGADFTANYKTDENWGTTLFEATGGVSTVVETGGAGSLAQSLAALGPNGHVALIGAFSGFEAPLNLMSIVGKAAHVHGITVGSREDFESMLALVEQHQIKPVIDHTVPFDGASDALNAMPAGKHMGKIVIEM